MRGEPFDHGERLAAPALVCERGGEGSGGLLAIRRCLGALGDGPHERLGLAVALGEHERLAERDAGEDVSVEPEGAAGVSLRVPEAPGRDLGLSERAVRRSTRRLLDPAAAPREQLVDAAEPGERVHDVHERRLPDGIELERALEQRERLLQLPLVEAQVSRHVQDLLVLRERLDRALVEEVGLLLIPVDVRLPGLDEQPLLRGDAAGAADGRLDGGAACFRVEPGELAEVRDPVMGQRELGIGGEGRPVRLERLLVSRRVHRLLAAEEVGVRLEAGGRRGRHVDARGAHLRRALAQPAARLLGQPVDHSRHARLSLAGLLEREQVLARARIERLQLDGVQLVEAPDRGEHQRARAGAPRHLAAERFIDFGHVLAPELPQDVDHPDPGQHRQPARLLERRDEHPGESAELGLPGLVLEVGDGDRDACLARVHRRRGRGVPVAQREGNGDDGDRDGEEATRGRGPPRADGPASAHRRGARAGRPPELGLERQQSSGDLRAVAGPLDRILREHARDEGAERGQLGDTYRRRGLRARGGFPVVVGGERQLPGDHLVEDHPERVHVGPLVLGRAAPLLRRHVPRRPAAEASAPERVREPEVEHLHPAFVREEDVARRQVAVHDALAVRVRERVSHVGRDAQRLGQLDLLLGEARRERLPVE